VAVSAQWGGRCGLRSEQRRAGVSVVMAEEGHAGARKGETADGNGLNAIEGKAA
jgi:hypothetical protein